MKKAARILLYLFLITGALICLLPLYWLIRSSLMSLSQIFMMPPKWVPDPFVFSNYEEALTILPFGRYFLNTFFIVIMTVAGTVITSAVSAYSFARIQWKGRDTVFGILMTSMMLPYAVTLIPTFIGWTALGMVDTYVPLIAPAWFGGGMFSVFLLRQFFIGLPKELDESAVLDGAGKLRIFISIVLPLSKPALISVALFAFMNAWNDFLAPLVYINSEEKFTLALGLQQFQGMYNAQWHLMMAAATMTVIPMVILFLIGQKYFIEGIATSGLKG